MDHKKRKKKENLALFMNGGVVFRKRQRQDSEHDGN